MSNADGERLKIATMVITASGMVRAAAYMANMEEACVGMQFAGSIEAGEISPAMENPPATMTLTAVITDAMRMALGEEECVVMVRGSGMKMDGRTSSRRKGDARVWTPSALLRAV
jgi:hypothetical protein